MKKRKLKAFVIPTTLATFGVLAITTALLLTNNNNTLEKAEEHLNYVSNTILSQDIAVINTNTKVIYPYTDLSVTIGKSYYDYKASSEQQEKSIIYHENTYIQNSGVDFVAENTFEVIAVLDGTVSNVKEDKVLGKIVEINHGNDYVSIYQSLSEVKVKKGDTVTQGQTLGVSGTNELDKTLGNHLHFEFYAEGQIVDPTLYLDKEISKKSKED